MRCTRVMMAAVGMVMLGLISTVYADAHGYIGLSQYEFLPFGKSPRAFYPAGPQSWKIQGWDLTLGIRGNKIIKGPLYWGGGVGMLFGGGSEDFNGSTTWVNENYFRFGFDGHLELGYRLPFDQINEHLDMGAKLGGYYDGGSGSESSFYYSHTGLWVGPAITFEPNQGKQGVVAGATLRFPLAGAFSVQNLSGPDTSFDLKSKHVLRLEAGYKFKNGFGIVVYGEKGGYEYEDAGVSFDQETSSLGIEMRITTR